MTIKRPTLTRISFVLAGILGALLLALGLCEWAAWPMLRRPVENWASQRLDRPVSFEGSGSDWQLHLLGGVRLDVKRMTLGAPDWSTLGPTLAVSDARLQMRWRDVLALRHGQPLAIRSLEAGNVALRVQRLADGRASWQFGKSEADPDFNGVHFEQLVLKKGTAIVDDRISSLSIVGSFALYEGSALDATASSEPGIQAQAEGRYRGLPLKAQLRSGSALPWLSADPNAAPVAVDLQGQLGEARLLFKGQVRDLLARQGLDGHYTLSGPSLAAVGQALDITLPTTPRFSMQGHLSREGRRWTTAVEQAVVGRSRLSGEFVYLRPADRAEGLPLLTGQLRSPLLWWADLGPTVGKPVEGAPAAAAAQADRILPQRAFDLPSLRAMNADVQMAFERVESGDARLQAVKPLQAHLRVTEGVLELDKIDARLAQGRITGRLRLDGRANVAAWDVQLGLRGLQIEQWLMLQPRQAISGRLGGQLNLKGRGRSVAEMLANADGSSQLFWTRGRISHLLVEKAGIDIAQSLGLWLKGDESLPVTCAAADLAVRQGVVKPQLFTIDTSDSSMSMDGNLSLASERLSLVLHVAPKDRSPLSLRAPVLIGGSFARPSVSLDKQVFARKVLPAAALAAINPLAALLPLIDLGDGPGREALQACQALLAQRGQNPQ